MSIDQQYLKILLAHREVLNTAIETSKHRVQELQAIYFVIHDLDESIIAAQDAVRKATTRFDRLESRLSSMMKQEREMSNHLNTIKEMADSLMSKEEK